MPPRSARLRPARPGDAQLIFRWRNSMGVRRWMFGEKKITPQEHQRWMRGVLSGSKGRLYLYEEDRHALGLVHFRLLSVFDGLWEWGFYMGERDRPPRSGERMLRLALRAFHKLPRAHKLIAEVFDFNTRSLLVHKRLGFKQEGVMKKHRFKNGRWRTVYYFSLFKKGAPRR